MISVVICTHNARVGHLTRVIDALKRQTLSAQQWELLVVDNASTPPVAPLLDLRWHPCARLVREETLGLTYARLRGIKEMKGSLVLFVDDDNVLDSNYLENLADLAAKRPYIAAFGANISGEFESSPPPWYDGLLGWLAIVKTKRDIWGNSYNLEQLPVGAGLCVRRDVADAYATALASSPTRVSLDRCGSSLNSGGDTDIVLTAIDMGFGVGVFTSLHLTHLIPSERLTKKYLLQLAEAMAFSKELRGRIGRGPLDPESGWRRRLLDLFKRPLVSSFERKMLDARHRGKARAARELSNSGFRSQHN